jgi:hypothetical protein
MSTDLTTPWLVEKPPRFWRRPRGRPVIATDGDVRKQSSIKVIFSYLVAVMVLSPATGAHGRYPNLAELAMLPPIAVAYGMLGVWQARLFKYARTFLAIGVSSALVGTSIADALPREGKTQEQETLFASASKKLQPRHWIRIWAIRRAAYYLINFVSDAAFVMIVFLVCWALPDPFPQMFPSLAAIVSTIAVLTATHAITTVRRYHQSAVMVQPWMNNIADRVDDYLDVAAQ